MNVLHAVAAEFWEAVEWERERASRLKDQIREALRLLELEEPQCRAAASVLRLAIEE